MPSSDTRFGSFEDLMADLPPDVEQIASRLRELILDLHPDAVEIVRLGDRAATYGVGPKKMSEAYTYIGPQTGYVNLGFFRGASLPDPDGLLEGTGAAMRHTKLRTLAEVDRPAVHTLVETALTERRHALGLDGLAT